jgi:hypothetical protein
LVVFLLDGHVKLLGIVRHEWNVENVSAASTINNPVTVDDQPRIRLSRSPSERMIIIESHHDDGVDTW